MQLKQPQKITYKTAEASDELTAKKTKTDKIVKPKAIEEKYIPSKQMQEIIISMI